MRKLSSVLFVLAVAGIVSTASAKDRSRRKLPRPQLLTMSQVKIVDAKSSKFQQVSLQTPTLAVQDAPPAPSGGPDDVAPKDTRPAITLFRCVEYVDVDEMAPCAVPMIAQVPDPCARRNPCQCRCQCCCPKMVYVKICVPRHCCPPRIEIKDDGREYVYRFGGDYHVDVRVRDGFIEVDYQD